MLTEATNASPSAAGRTSRTSVGCQVNPANGGQVIAPSDVDLLFEPFRRGGKVRTATRGSGLGLSIVRLIVEAHHGRLQAAAPPFGGLAVRIELPDATSPTSAITH